MPPDAPGAGPRPPLNILLVEDNAFNQKLALRILERMGFQAELVVNGAEALDRVLGAAAGRPYDVVLMDVQMPELDGLETARRICAALAGPERPYIIAMTANASPEDRRDCLAAGMHDYVPKPIDVPDLRAALERAARARATGLSPAPSGDPSP